MIRRKGIKTAIVRAGTKKWPIKIMSKLGKVQSYQTKTSIKPDFLSNSSPWYVSFKNSWKKWLYYKVENQQGVCRHQ